MIDNTTNAQPVQNPMTVNGLITWSNNPGTATHTIANIRLADTDVTHIMVSKQQYMDIIAENALLRTRIAELEKHAIHNAVDDVFIPDEDSHDTTTEPA